MSILAMTGGICRLRARRVPGKEDGDQVRIARRFFAALALLKLIEVSS